MGCTRRHFQLFCLTATTLLAVVGGGAHAEESVPAVQPATSHDTRCSSSLAPGGGDVQIFAANLVGPAQTIESAGPVEQVGVGFCRVRGVIEKEIGFELWLPLSADWNGYLLGAGVGGQAGTIAYAELARGVARGFASTSTDTGHKASDEHWLLNRPDRAANYAGRSNHLLAERAKVLVAAYYGEAAGKSFFIGCSGGGRQGMTEAQRYPADYDAIIVGAPGVNTPEMSARRLWEILQHDRYAGVLSAEDWAFIARQGNAYCDRADGSVDGFADNPLDCDFAVGMLACERLPSGGRCLSPQQIEVAERIYGPLTDESGKRIDSGLLPGIRVSPVPVPEPFTPGPRYLATVLFSDGVHGDPNWNIREFNISRDLPAIDRVANLHADDPDLDAFIARGGKLIIYQGWADPLVSPAPTLEYLGALFGRYGSQSAVDEFLSLFMVPGMEHCRGGDVPDHFGGAGGIAGQAQAPSKDNDLLSAMMHWVESGERPQRIDAEQAVGGSVIRARPICAYPARPQYTGEAPEVAGSWQCRD